MTASPASMKTMIRMAIEIRVSDSGENSPP